MAALQDVTGQSSAQLDVQRLAAIVESSDDAIISKTLQGLVLSWNAAAERIFGYTAAEIIGRPIDRLIPLELRQEEREIIGKIALGEAISHSETFRVAKDGRSLPVSLTISPLRDTAGHIVGASTIARDLTERRRAEQFSRIAEEKSAALVRSDTRTRAILDTAVDGVILMDARGTVAMFNRACERLFGYSASEIVGGNVKRLMAPPYRDEHDQYLLNYRRTGKRNIIGGGREVLGQRRSGEVFPLDLSVGEAEIDGEITYVGVLRDVSERKRGESRREELIRELTEAQARAEVAARSLAESERLMALVLDALPDLVAYWTADLKCLAVNKSFLNWFGKRREDLIEATVAAAFGETAMEPVKNRVSAVLAGVPQKFEVPRQTNSGQLRQTLTNYIPDLVDGKVVGFIVQVSDITPLKVNEAELRAAIARHEIGNRLLEESGKALEMAQRLGQVGSWDWNVENKALSWSDELYRIFELDPSSPPRPLEEISGEFLPESAERLRAALGGALKQGLPYSIELALRGRDGGVRWLEARGEAAREHGRTVELRGTMQDITTRKLGEEQREQLITQLTAANEERARFAHAASHDLKEPLRMVQAFCGRLQKEYGERLDTRGAEYLSLAVAGASRMSRMLEDLVDFDRVSAGARGAWFESRAEVDRALANLEERIRDTSASVEVGPLPPVFGNAIRFERLMQNLIGNALKYVAPGVAPQISVRAERETGFWRFSIADNGIGIDPRFHARIFEPFKRLHARDRYDGSGLGLTMCRKIVEGFGGALGVESGDGEGSTFSFTVRVEDKERDGVSHDA